MWIRCLHWRRYCDAGRRWVRATRRDPPLCASPRCGSRFRQGKSLPSRRRQRRYHAHSQYGQPFSHVFGQCPVSNRHTLTYATDTTPSGHPLAFPFSISIGNQRRRREATDVCGATASRLQTLINVRIAKAGLTVSEVPSLEQERLHGVSNLNAVTDGLRVLRTIVRERAIKSVGAGSLEDNQIAARGAEAHEVEPRAGFPRKANSRGAPAPTLNSH